MHKVAILVLMLGSTLALMPAKAVADTTGSLAGYVVDEKGQSVSGVNVSASCDSQFSSTTTNAVGFYVFVSLSPGSCRLSFHATAYSGATRTAYVTSGRETWLATTRIVRIEIGAVIDRHNPSYVRSAVMNDVYTVLTSTLGTEFEAPFFPNGVLAAVRFGYFAGIILAPGGSAQTIR